MEDLAIGLGVICLGFPAVLWPSRTARVGKGLDAYGSMRTLTETEPADWMVTVTRVLGVGFVLAGLLFVLLG